MPSLSALSPDATSMWLLAFALAALGSHVGIDHALRARDGADDDALRRLTTAGIGFGTALWSVMVLLIASQSAGRAFEYHAAGLAGAWMLAVGGAAVAFRCPVSFGGAQAAMRRMPSWLGRAVAVALFGASVVASGVAVVSALGLQPGATWQGPELIAAFAVGSLGGLAALAWQDGPRVGRMRHLLRRGGAALLLGASTLGAHALVLDGCGLPLLNATAVSTGVQAVAVVTLASIGAGALLLTLATGSLVERRLGGQLRSTRVELQRQAFVDALTGLPNRLVFDGSLAQATAAADAARGRTAVLFVDVDGFKINNDAYGHEVGDRLLQHAGRAVAGALGDGQIAARLGGDQFLALVPRLAGLDEASRLADRIALSLRQPCRIDGRDFELQCSIGIAVFPEHGAASVLIAHAEAAVRAAKSLGGATHCFFEPRMIAAQGTREQAELLRDLRQAVSRGQLQLFYQPKIDGPSGEITGAEALLRWHHPRRGLVSPAEFIPIAERYGLIGAVGNWVIDEACRQIGAWRDQGLRMRVAINISVHQLRQADLPDRIAAAIGRGGFSPRLLTCEITESAVMEDPDGAMALLAKLAAIGVHISIDDFGNGQSALGRLREMRRLPVEELKIDRAFVVELETSEEARSVVEFVVQLARLLQMKVVAEGVETEAQARILAGLGCDQLQGYRFAKPMSAAALALWAMHDEGPRALDFRDSLFTETVPAELA
jgi:diguanylate cyclase (GGDEF)-like protein